MMGTKTAKESEWTSLVKQKMTEKLDDRKCARKRNQRLKILSVKHKNFILVLVKAINNE